MLASATQGRHERLPLKPEGILGNVVLLVKYTFWTLLHRELLIFVMQLYASSYPRLYISFKTNWM